MPLGVAPIGKSLLVVRIAADDKTKRHLENLGILSGAMLKVLSESNGNVILEVKDGRLAINTGTAMQIMVKEGA